MIDTVSGEKVHGPKRTVLLPPEKPVEESTDLVFVEKSIILSECT